MTSDIRRFSQNLDEIIRFKRRELNIINIIIMRILLGLLLSMTGVEALKVSDKQAAVISIEDEVGLSKLSDDDFDDIEVLEIDEDTIDPDVEP